MNTTIWRWVSMLLLRCGVDPRAWRALTGAFLLMDFRGPHYSQSTGVRPREVLSPLFCVIGQCLLLSAIVAVVLFLRVDVFFYAFANLSVSMIVIAAAVVVEFNEVVFDARDQDVVAPRPVSSRTYSAARFTNLLAYVLAMWFALNVFPLIVGAGLYDAGPWYAPAYLVASLSADVITAGAVILLLSGVSDRSRLERWKDVLAWTQVLLLLIAGYGAQLMFRRGDHALELWAAFPPAWVRFVPSAWAASFVELAAVTPSVMLLPYGVGLVAGGLLVCAATVNRLGRQYAIHNAGTSAATGRRYVMPRVGTLASGAALWVCRNRSERAGFWLARTLLARDAGLRMRCLYAYNTVAAVVLLGIATGQFADPMQSQDLDVVLLPILAVYLTALSVPVALYNLTFVRDSAASWCLRAAPTDPPEGIARGVCKAIQLYVNAPLCLLWGVAAGWCWGAPVSAALHAGLAWMVCWPTALAALWLANPAAPFSREPSRGGSIGPIVLPMAGFSAAAMLAATAHSLYAGEFWFWIVAAAACIAATRVAGRRADRRLRALWKGAA